MFIIDVFWLILLNLLILFLFIQGEENKFFPLSEGEIKRGCCFDQATASRQAADAFLLLQSKTVAAPSGRPQRD